MSPLVSTVLAIGVLCALALIAAGVYGLRRPGRDRLRAGLMIAAGLVTLLNVYLFSTMPVPS
jgi:hypothetical protein